MQVDYCGVSSKSSPQLFFKKKKNSQMSFSMFLQPKRVKLFQVFEKLHHLALK